MSEEEMKTKIRDLLVEGKIKFFVGYEKGTNPFLARPVMISDENLEKVDDLEFSVLCSNNLTLYIIEDRKKILPRGVERDERPIGLVVKGCDSRAINVLLQENMIKREDVFLVGLPCEGVVDPNKARDVWYKRSDRLNPEDLEINEKGMFVNGEKIADFDEIEADRCRVCLHRNPVAHDELVWDEVEEPKLETREKRYEKIREYESLSPEKKWDFWKKELSKCIRCYSCKNICPLCYCEECSLAKDQLQAVSPEEKSRRVLWVGREVDLLDNLSYHLNRAMHLAGRCIDCGECERSCPVNIPLRLLYNEVEKNIYETFQYEAGINPDEEPVLTTFGSEEARNEECFL